MRWRYDLFRFRRHHAGKAADSLAGHGPGGQYHVLAGRGSHQATQLAEETDYACRAAAAKLFGVADESNVIFTGNATHGLNIAIHTLVQPGSRVVISGYEHNAVTRPLHAIPNVTLTVLDTPPFQPERMVEELKAALAQGRTW